MIYIIHPIVIPLVRTVLSKIGIFTIYDYLAPILIFAVSLAFSVLYYTVKNLILRIINHKKIS